MLDGFDVGAMFQAFWSVVSGLLLVAGMALGQAGVLVDFQVAEPPPVPLAARQCTVQLIQHTFGNSYYVPAYLNYTPPTDCGEPGTWAAITLNLTVTSNGTQYDRLGTFTFHNVEIWRTSTPEPTYDGIIWTYVKDVTRYTPLFAEPGLLIFELDNIVTSQLTGEYASTVTATFYESSLVYQPAKQANTIIPISTLSDTLANDASVPPSFSLNVTVPQNAVQIYAEIFASGNAEEEFWYLNVANEFYPYLTDVTYGDGPFREVRFLVDGQVAGVAFPYAVIFTGGITPTAWRPITSYGALDLPTYFIDLTPFVPILTDGEPHNITLDVASAETDHAINGNWYVSANLQVITDPSGKPTTGSMTVYQAEPYAVTTTSGTMGNGDINVTVTATRQIHIESEIISGSGVVSYSVFDQNLYFSNTQYYLDNFQTQNAVQTSSGTVTSTLDGVTVLSDTFSYPLTVDFSYLNSSDISWMSTIDHSYDRTVVPSPLEAGSVIQEHQIAGGYFYITATGNYGNGTSTNTFSYADYAGNTYYRNVNAVNDNVTYDESGGSLAWDLPSYPVFSVWADLLVAVARLPGGKTMGVPQ